MGDEINDYDSIAEMVGNIMAEMIGNSHAPCHREDSSDSITITKDGFIRTVVGLQRLQDWVKGLAESHRANRAVSVVRPEED